MKKGDCTFSLIIVVIIISSLSTGYLVNKAKCSAKTISFEDSNYGLFQGCMVKHNGRWLPLDNIRGFDGKG